VGNILITLKMSIDDRMQSCLESSTPFAASVPLFGHESETGFTPGPSYELGLSYEKSKEMY
jgi:hypothetical protein